MTCGSFQFVEWHGFGLLYLFERFIYIYIYVCLYLLQFGFDILL